MKKLALNIEDLEVESFETLSGMNVHGTINARNGDAADPMNPVDPVDPVDPVEPVPATAEQFCTAFCKTVGGLPCDTDLCRTKQQYTVCPRSCGAIICIPF